MKKLLIISVAIVACAANAEPAKETASPLGLNIPGYVHVTIKTGTNVVEKLPFTSKLQPFVKDFKDAQCGDTFIWGKEKYTFDGKDWSGKDGGKVHVPIHDKFLLIRTANVTNVWTIGGYIDLNKAPKK